jgi:hypothetical protein
MIERLLAGQEEMKADRKTEQAKADADREQMLAKMEDIQERMNANMKTMQERMDANTRTMQEDVTFGQAEMRLHSKCLPREYGCLDSKKEGLFKRDNVLPGNDRGTSRMREANLRGHEYLPRDDRLPRREGENPQ